MRIPRHPPASADDRCGLVRSLLAQSLERGTFVVPRLPEAAVRIVELREDANALQLSAVIKADPALSMYVLRIAASAPNRPAMPIVSLTHAVAWLGLDEVANMAFTLALQPKMLDVPGHQRKARRLWRHSLASALWSRQLALALEREPGLCYLCGLLHDIGKAVTLREAHELARWSGTLLESSDYDRIVDEFHREVAACVVTTWGMPEAIVAVATRWGAALRRRALRMQHRECRAEPRGLHRTGSGAAHAAAARRGCRVPRAGFACRSGGVDSRVRPGRQRRAGPLSVAVTRRGASTIVAP